MRIKVLGPVEVAVDGDLLGLGGPQQRLVLAMLVSRVDEPVTTESLIDALWRDDETPDRARKTVQVYVANLRKVLGGPDAPIESAPGGYVLRSAAVSVDAVDFEQALEATGPAADTTARDTVELLSAALGLWAGPAYADLGDAPALTAEVARLSGLRLVALERRVEASLELGHHRDVLSALETLTTDHPYRERFTALHMLALYRSGRQAEALRAYQRTRLVLGEELGIDPSPEVQALEQAILAQDPSLDLPESPAGELASAPAAMAPDSRSIRGYELREQLGEHDDAALWRAYQPATGREVTLRIFAPDVANEPAFVKRFESEAQRVAQLEHPHLVSIYDFWRDPEGAYVVMPLLRGGTLADSLRRGRWKLSAALRMLDQVGSALAALHRHGLHHGSLGPDSVFLDSDANAYLADAAITGGPEPAGEAASDVVDLSALLALTVAPDQLPAELDEVLDTARDLARVEDLLRAVRQATGSDAVGVASDLESDRPAATNPYKGLRAFQETDAADFFGRETLVSRLVDTVADQPLTAVVGSSGSGKSSLVKAGLIPAVKGGALDGDWLVAEMFPGTFPFEELEAALLGVAVDRPDGLIADLTADDRGMLRVIKRVLPDDGTGLLLVIDQFEELFSLTPDEETRRNFLDNLVTLGSDARSRVRTVLTLRADFFDRPLDHPEFADLIRRGLVTVATPDEDSLAMMISQPARRAGLDLEPGLATEVVRDVMEQPGGLPLMQYALTELTERSDGRTLTSAGYRESGGVLGALGQRAEETYQGLQPSAREVAERIFLRLVTVDENADDTRRRIRRTELEALGLDRDAVEAVLQEFGSFRLLSFDHDPTTRGPTVEVAHEALIREWPRLRSWVDDQRESLLLERRLREAVVEWDASGRDVGYLLRGGRLQQFESWAQAAPAHVTEDERRLIEQSRAAADAEEHAERRRVRRLRRLLIGVGAFAVLALVAGVLALQQSRRADDEAARAEFERLVALAGTLPEENLQLGMLAAVEAFDMQDGAESRGALQEALMAEPQFAGRAEVVGDVGPPTFGPDGEWLFVPEVPPGEEATVGTWYDSTTLERIGSVRVADRWRLHSAPDRTLVAATWLFPPFDGPADDRQSQVRVHDANGQELATLRTSGYPSWVRFLDGDRLVVNDDAGLTIWDVQSFEVRQTIELPESLWIESIEVNGDGSRLLVSSPGAQGAVAMLVDLDEGAVVPGTVTPCEWRCRVAFAPSGDLVAIARTDSAVIHDAASWELVTTIVTPGDVVESLTFSEDGATLYVGTTEGGLFFYDARTGDRSAPSVDTRAGATWAIMSAPTEHIITYSSQGTIQRWSLDRSGPFGTWLESGQGFGIFSPDSSRFLRTNDPTPGWITVYDPATGGVVESLELMPTVTLGAVTVSPDGKRIAVGATNGELVLYDAEAFEPTGEALQDQGFAFATFSPDGRRLAVGANFTPAAPFEAHVWHLDSGTVTPLELTADFEAAGRPSWSPDGTRVAISDFVGGDAVFDPADGSQVGSRFSVRGQDQAIEVLWESDGRSLLGIGASGVSRWDVTTGERSSPFTEATPGDVMDLADDGRLLVTASRLGEARLWDLGAGVPLGVPFPDPGVGLMFQDYLPPVPALSPDGQYLALSGGRGTVLWALGPHLWRDHACRLAGRNMTPSEWVNVMGDVPYSPTCDRWA